jgi:hypothetical protein
VSALGYLLTGIIVSWPPAAGGLWLTWWLARRKVAEVTRKANETQTAAISAITRQQTADISDMADRQTATLLGQDPAGSTAAV